MVCIGVLSLAVVAQVVDAQMMSAGALVRAPRDGQLHLEDLQVVEVPAPGPPGATQVRVQVAGSSINPADWKFIATDVSKYYWSYPHVFGRDCTGTVIEVGLEVSRLKVGDAVWADNSDDEGCYAEIILLEESLTGLAPTTIPLTESALLPLVGLTAKQAMNFGGLPAASVNSIVVLGGSGGVGHVALQIARAWAPDAHITTTCGTRNLEFCAEMGADTVIDYHAQNWQDVIPARSADIVFDTVCYDNTGDDAYKILKDGGAFATLLPGAVASNATADSRPSVKQQFYFTKFKNYRELDTLRELVDAGKLKPVLDQTYTFSEIAAAYNHSIVGHSTGKVSVVPSSAVTI